MNYLSNKHFYSDFNMKKLILLSLMTLFGSILSSQYQSYIMDTLSRRTNETYDIPESTLEVGKTVNIFPRYGSFVYTMKIWPTTMNERLSTEDTMAILTESTLFPHSRYIEGRNTFEDDFLIDFCDDEDSLLSSFFENFEVEGVPKSYKAFTAFSSTKGITQSMGIHSSFWGKQHSFVLVRLYKRKNRTLINNKLHLSSDFVENVKNMRIGSPMAAHKFMDDFGSHILVDFEVGDMFYQVFVFGKHVYKEMKKKYIVRERSLGSAGSGDNTRGMDIQDYFTPYYALHIGEVKLASGDEKFHAMSEKLETRYFLFRVYESIFHILSEKKMEQTLESLDGEAIIGMKLKKITRVLEFTPETYWLRLILDNTLSLYYTTIR